VSPHGHQTTILKFHDAAPVALDPLQAAFNPSEGGGEPIAQRRPGIWDVARGRFCFRCRLVQLRSCSFLRTNDTLGVQVGASSMLASAGLPHSVVRGPQHEFRLSCKCRAAPRSRPLGWQGWRADFRGHPAPFPLYRSPTSDSVTAITRDL
jgi:hypothetical protein